MTPAIWLRDVFMYSLQVCLLVGAAAALAALLNDRVSKAGLVFWQALLIACLALPLCQSWRPSSDSSFAMPLAAAASIDQALNAPGSSVATRQARWSPQGIVLSVLATGIVLRLAWLFVGLWALHRLRRTSSPVPEHLEPFESARRKLGVEARFYSSTSAPSPVTFGLRRPVVLLPERVLSLGIEKQTAIACHELLHVKRHDWIQQVFEECLRGLLWFHPAIWWLLERIQLTREQVVDQQVIELTESRQHYVEALLAVAAFPHQPRLLPATLFLKKSRLRRRVNELFREASMSRPRLLLSIGASIGVVLFSAALAVRLFPLEARAAEGTDPVSIDIKTAGAQLLHARSIEYPGLAIKKGVEGVVEVEVSVDEAGLVADARVLAGPMELRSAVLSSALRWHFAPKASSATAVATVTFRLPAEGELKTFQYQGGTVSVRAPLMRSSGELSERQRAERELELLEQKLKQAGSPDEEAVVKSKLIATRKMLEQTEDGQVRGWATLDDRAEHQMVEDQLVERQLKERLAQLKDPQLGPEEMAAKKREVEELSVMLMTARAQKERLSGRLVQIRSERVPDDTLRELMSRLSLSVGDTIDSETMGRVTEAVRGFDEHYRVSFQRNPEGGIVLVILAP